MRKNLFVSALILVFFLAFLIQPSTTHALAYFGGMQTYYFKCTCDQNFYTFVWDYASKRPLQLIYSPGASNLLVGTPFGRNQIGSYIPGAGICMMYAGLGCAPLPNDGLIGGGLPGYGTSF